MENLEILVNKTQTINIFLWIQFQKWKFWSLALCEKKVLSKDILFLIKLWNNVAIYYNKNF